MVGRTPASAPGPLAVVWMVASGGFFERRAGRGRPARTRGSGLQLCRIPSFAKTKWHCARVGAPHLPVSQCEVILAAVLSQATEPVAARATLTASMAFGSTPGGRA